MTRLKKSTESINNRIKTIFSKLNPLGFLRRRWWILLFAGGLGYWIIYLIQNCYKWPNGCTGFAGKTAWDVAELVLIPVSLVVVAAVMNGFERKADREISNDNQQEIALQNYFDSIINLILHEGLRESNRDDEVGIVAQAKTDSTIMRLNSFRKGKMLLFLSKLSLVNRLKNKDPIIFLEYANLELSILNGLHLESGNFNQANFNGADLNYAFLNGAILYGAQLMEAHLFNAHLEKAMMMTANLNKADLQFAYLMEADLTGADLRKADLFHANLQGSNLNSTNFEGAYLNRARLNGTILKNTEFFKAIMPDGNVYDPSIHTPEYITTYLPPIANVL